MRVILGIVGKNIGKNKLRSSLIVFTLTLITILTFISVGAKNCTENIVTTMSKKYVGDADILIQPTEVSKNPYFNIANEYDSEDYEYIVEIADMKCLFPKKDNKNESINLRGIDVNNLKNNYGINVDELNKDDFSGRKAIIGKKFATDMDLKTGDEFIVKTENYNETLKVYAVVEDKGIFLQDGKSNFVIVPLKYMQNRLEVGNRVNKALIKLKNPEDRGQIINRLKDKFSDYEVREAIVQSDIDTAVNNQTSSYKVITIIVILLAIVIISYIFKIISIERIPIIGTLRSLGAKKNISLIILLSEALYLSIVASILGCVSGIFIMKIILEKTIPSNLENVGIGVTYSIMQFIVSVLITVLVAASGAIIPTLKISKLSIKNIIFGLDENKNDNNRSILKLIIALILAAIAVFTPRDLVNDFKVIFEAVSLAMLIISIILIIPYIVDLFVSIGRKIFKDVGNNIVYLSLSNFKNNKNILSNITLLTVSLSTFILVNSITSSVVNNRDDLYRDNAKFDMFVWYESSNSTSKKDETERLCYQDNNIKDLYTTLISYNHKIDKTNFKIEKLIAGNTNQYFNYWKVDLTDNLSTDDVKDELNKGRNIIITSVMKERLGVKVGDSIPLLFGTKVINYKVIAFMDSVNTNGNNAIVSEENFLKDVEGKYNKEICINTVGNVKEAKERIYENLNNDNLYVETIDEMEVKNYESYRGIYTMLKVLSAVVFLVSIIGIINNQLINYIQRKKYFSIERSIGMSKKQLSIMLLLESVCGGIIGGVIALIGGNVLVYIIPNFLKANGQVLNVSYSFMASLNAVGIGVIITIICSIMIIVKSSKLSIIESIRYE